MHTNQRVTTYGYLANVNLPGLATLNGGFMVHGESPLKMNKGSHSLHADNESVQRRQHDRNAIGAGLRRVPTPECKPV
uniref:Uncharacterized protein n=1 Tax=mine drainage metagenome TaxID=410659 RepID=E6QCD8_9ZZZZ